MRTPAQDLLVTTLVFLGVHFTAGHALTVERVIKVILSTNHSQTPSKFQNVPPKSVSGNFLTARSVLNRTEPSGS